MKKIISAIAVSASLICANFAWAANTAYSFDTVTAINLHVGIPSVTGIEKDTGNSITVSFKTSFNAGNRYVINRCVPVFLTVMDKPGRYFLHLVVNPSNRDIGLISCEIELKN